MSLKKKFYNIDFSCSTRMLRLKPVVQPVLWRCSAKSCGQDNWAKYKAFFIS